MILNIFHFLKKIKRNVERKDRSRFLCINFS